MSKSRYLGPSRAIGRTLKSWREERGYTLRTVAKSSKAYPERITFDYLSRVERGQLMPSVPKLATLAGVFGKPLMQLIDLYELEQLRKLVPRTGSYTAFRKLGIESLEKGLITKALACFLGALDAAQREDVDTQTLAVALNNVGSAMNRSERYILARQFLEEGLRYVENEHSRARLLDNLSVAHYHLDNLNVAELLSREACRLAGNDPVLRPLVIATRSAILLDLKRYEEAEPLMREVVDGAREGSDEAREIRWLFNLGHCLVEQNKAEEGLEHLRTASTQAAERGDPELRAKSLYYLGRGLYRSGRTEEASLPLKSSLLISQSNEFRNEAFRSAYYLWQLARERGHHAEESDYLEMTTQYRERLEQRSDESRAFDDWSASLPARVRGSRKAAPPAPTQASKAQLDEAREA